MTDTYWGLFVGYSFIWAVVAFYVYSFHRRLSALEKQLDESETSKE